MEEEHGEEESELEIRNPNPIILDKLIDDRILYSAHNTLDEDFNFLLAFVPVLFKTLPDGRDKTLCEEWLDKLLGLRAHNVGEKRERNIYLVNLLLNIGKGEFTEPFDDPPPSVLLPGLVVFGGTPKAQVCPENLNLEVEDFAEYSKDSRTFFAAKALPGGNGAFGYLAVSLGGGDALWLDCRGNSVDPSTIRKQTSCQKESPENTQMFESLREVVSKRSPQKDRSELLPYYYGVMQRIREITSSVDTECEIYDPVIEKMIEDLQIDIISEGKIDVSEIACFGKKSWLCTLEKKIAGLMEAAEQRDLALNDLERMLFEHEKDEISFLNVSNAIKPPKMDPILAEAVRDRPSEYNVAMLRRGYQEDIVTTFLKLLENEKMIVVNQERMAFDGFVMNVRAEVLNEAKFGIERYNVARKELQRVTKVMRKVEEIKTRLLKDVEKTTATTDTSNLEKEHLIDSEIKEAKLRLEESQAQSDKIEGKIAKLHDQIHQFTSEYHVMLEDGKRELDYNLREISDLRAQVAAQERKLLMLKHKVEESAKVFTCEIEKPCDT